MFQRIASQRLRQLAEELATLGDQEPGPGEEKAIQFARSLSVLMRCELADRRQPYQAPEQPGAIEREQEQYERALSTLRRWGP